MSAGGKGRISNELVAASCAAVLAVYAAGYWRTRDESRRIDIRAQERRAAQPAASPANSTPALVQPVTPSTAPEPGTSRAMGTMQAVAATTPPKETLESIPATSPPEASPSATAPPATPVANASAAAVAFADQPEPAPMPDPPPVPVASWRDGTYTGWGTSRHGDIKAQVVIRDGRIVEAGIASCETRYPCDVIGDIIAQPVARQSPEVDHVSRATESADAYYYGLVEALKEAQIAPVQGAAPR